jgi:integral membrane protein (TIGR01906 family)
MKKVFCVFTILALSVYFLLFSVFSVVNENDFYYKQYVKNSTEDATGMTIENLMAATDVLQDYMVGERDDLEMTVMKFGQKVPMFNPREKEHMKDVKLIYQNASKTMDGALIRAGVVFVYMLILDKFKGTLANLRQALKISTVIIGIFAIVIAFMLLFNFDWFWINLHKMLFSNNLWILNPESSTMVNMFGDSFFLDMCTSILAKFAGLYAVLFFAVGFGDKFANNREKRKTV